MRARGFKIGVSAIIKAGHLITQKSTGLCAITHSRR
jgi:hypothetical protein